MTSTEHREKGSSRQRSVLVTGCSSGFGLDTAVELARRGWHVIATMRNLGKRARLDESANAAGVTVDVVALDVCDAGSISRGVAQALALTGGRLDALVNNAGIGDAGYFEDMSDETSRRIMETNFFGVLAVTRQVLPMMREQRSGRLVVVSSIAAFSAPASLSIYAASKWAVEGWAESLAAEVAPFGIEVSLIEPGSYKTDIWESSGVARVGGSPYGQFVEIAEPRLRAIVERMGRNPREVALRVAAVLDARRPRLRNPVGPDSKSARVLSRIVPARTQRALLARLAGTDRVTV